MRCFPISDGKDIFENAQFNYRDFFKTIYHPAIEADVYFPAYGFEMSGLDVEIKTPAPTKGQHSLELLEELGYAESDIEGLLKGGVVYGSK